MALPGNFPRMPVSLASIVVYSGETDTPAGVWCAIVLCGARRFIVIVFQLTCTPLSARGLETDRRMAPTPSRLHSNLRTRIACAKSHVLAPCPRIAHTDVSPHPHGAQHLHNTHNTYTLYTTHTTTHTMHTLTYMHTLLFAPHTSTPTTVHQPRFTNALPPSSLAAAAAAAAFAAFPVKAKGVPGGVRERDD